MKHCARNWEISITELRNHIGKKYKVTKRRADLSIAETKIVRSSEEAKKQFEDCLRQIQFGIQ